MIHLDSDMSVGDAQHEQYLEDYQHQTKTLRECLKTGIDCLKHADKDGVVEALVLATEEMLELKKKGLL